MSSTFYPSTEGVALLGDRLRRAAMKARIVAADLKYASSIRRAEEASLALEPLGPALTDGPVLIDGCFWHPNYWLRCGLLRAAWGLGDVPKVGMVGRYARPSVHATMKRFGIARPRQFGDRLDRTGAPRKRAESYLAKVKHSEDILNWQLPHGIPGFDIYDGLLKIQRSATVDPHHPDVVSYVSDWFAHLDAFERMLDETRPSLAILSHTQSANSRSRWVEDLLFRSSPTTLLTFVPLHFRYYLFSSFPRTPPRQNTFRARRSYPNWSSTGYMYMCMCMDPLARH